jgi:hypothetical protein
MQRDQPGGRSSFQDRCVECEILSFCVNIYQVSSQNEGHDSEDKNNNLLSVILL